MHFNIFLYSPVAKYNVLFPGYLTKIHLIIRVYDFSQHFVLHRLKYLQLCLQHNLNDPFSHEVKLLGLPVV